ncbi:MAG: hypothetical protein WC701_03395 [Kiritimatiellales bacterium]|jgi:hypothetical protein
MEYTRYFLHTRSRPDRINIRLEWIQQVVENAEREEIQSDGRIRRWKKIADSENRYLRVILLEDGKTVHNAFFDRSFRENGDEN